NLREEEPFEAVVGACGREHRRIRGERQRRQPWTFDAKPRDQLGSKMQGIRGAAAVPEKNDLAAAAQGGRGFLRELCDPADQFAGKTLLHASAFLELAANLFGR